MNLELRDYIIIGKKIGCTIYYNGSDDLRLTPGYIHVGDGITHHMIPFPSEVLLSASTVSGWPSSTGWYYITLDQYGVLRARAGAGTSATRPTDSYYQWTGFNHLKQGYYYSSNERIIGAVYRTSATDWMINNELDGANEEGQWKVTLSGGIVSSTFTFGYKREGTYAIIRVPRLVALASGSSVNYLVAGVGSIFGMLIPKDAVTNYGSDGTQFFMHALSNLKVNGNSLQYDTTSIEITNDGAFYLACYTNFQPNTTLANGYPAQTIAYKLKNWG